jgi:hypothetical protein
MNSEFDFSNFISRSDMAVVVKNVLTHANVSGVNTENETIHEM